MPYIEKVKAFFLIKMLLYLCPSHFLNSGVIACSISYDDAFVSVYLSQVKYLMGSLTLIANTSNLIFPLFESTITLHISFSCNTGS